MLPSLSLPLTSASSPSLISHCSHVRDLVHFPFPIPGPSGCSLREPLSSLQPWVGTLGDSLNLWVSQVWHTESAFFLLSSYHTCLSYTGPGFFEASTPGWTPNPVLSTALSICPGTCPDSWIPSSCLPSLLHFSVPEPSAWLAPLSPQLSFASDFSKHSICRSQAPGLYSLSQYPPKKDFFFIFTKNLHLLVLPFFSALH